MNALGQYLRTLYHEMITAWNRFWFTPADAATLGVIRICTGLMLFYTHLVWGRDLLAFFGPDGWVSVEAARSLYMLPSPTPGGAPAPNVWYWSYLWYIDSPAWLYVTHYAGLVVFALLTIGLASRMMSVLAFVVAVSYVHRVPGALFGLDQINCMLALYLVVGSSGRAWSVDRWLARRRGGERAAPAVSTNIAIRLIQLHMCVIYFFAGVAKLQGETWWRGDALWGAFANLEYQTWDMTWLAHYPLIVGLMTFVVVFWELSFPAIIWPRLTRPIVLAIAIPLHLGIGICMGMLTFGFIMLVGCLSFVPPELVRAVIERRPTAAAETSTSAAGGRGPSGQGGRRPDRPKAGRRTRP